MASLEVISAWKEQNIESFKNALELDEENMFIHLDDYIYSLLDISEWKDGLMIYLQYDMIEELGMLLGSLKRLNYIESYEAMKRDYPNIKED